MALIICPECQREVSDTLNACPHCGYVLSSDSESIESAVSNDSGSLDVETPPVVKSKSTKTIKVIISSCVALVVVVTAFFFIFKTNQSKARATYLENLNTVKNEILYSAADAETLGNLVNAVWHDSIFEEYSSQTQKYVSRSFNSYYDFNTALKNLFADESTKESVRKIKTDQDKIASYIKDLQNPPEDLENCYEVLDDLYSAYLDLTNLVISPTGSLKSFNENFRESDDDAITNYNKLNAIIPEE